MRKIGKNQSYFYILVTNNSNYIFEVSIYNNTIKSKILNYKFNNICAKPACCKLQKTNKNIKIDVNKWKDIPCL